MTPLIDVIFLLLTYFIFALMVMVRADTLDIELPTLSAAGQSAQGDSITVTLAEDGSIRVDGEAVGSDQSLPEGDQPQAESLPLPAWVLAVQAAQLERPDAAIVLIADERGKVGALVGLFNGLHEAGIEAKIGLLSRSSPAGNTQGTGSVNPGP